MKLKFGTLLVLALVFFTSCKEEKAKEVVVEDSPKKELVDSKVKITLDMVVPEDDTFQIYYTEDGSPNCSEEQSVRTSVKGNALSQQVVFNVPEEVGIAYLRIDMGENPNQGTIKVNGFTYEYYGKKLESKGNDFFQYFAPTEQMTLNIGESTLTPVKSSEKYDPILYAQPPLAPKLEEMLK